MVLTQQLCFSILAAGRKSRQNPFDYLSSAPPLSSNYTYLHWKITQIDFFSLEVILASSLPFSKLYLTFPRILFSQMHFTLWPNKSNCPTISTEVCLLNKAFSTFCCLAHFFVILFKSFMNRSSQATRNLVHSITDFSNRRLP